MAAQAAKGTTLQSANLRLGQTGRRRAGESCHAAQHLLDCAALLPHPGQEVEQQHAAPSLHQHSACAVNARFCERIQQPNSRFSLHPATPEALPAAAPYLGLPAHRALAARLAAAASTSAGGGQGHSRQHHQPRQQQQQRHKPRNGNVWSVDLRADVQAVCKEVGLSQQVAAALAAAAAAGQVSANPGVLLSQLLRLLPLEGELRTPGSLAQLLTAQPALLHSDPATLLANLAAARQLLGRQRAARVALRNPQLLTCSAFRLHSNVAALQELLKFDSTAAAAGAAAEQPLLLLSSPRSLQLRWQQLQQLMCCVPAAELMKQLRRNPGLLLLRPSTIAAKMQCLQAVLGQADDGDAAELQSDTVEDSLRADAAAGSLSDVKSDAGANAATASDKQEQLRLQQQRLDVASALARLKDAAARRHAWPQQQQQQQQQVRRHVRPSSWAQHRQHTHKTSHLPPAASTAASSSSSSSSSARVQQLVLKVPGLLCLNPSTLQQHVRELQLLLGLQPGDAALRRVLLLQPGLLTQAPRTLANKLQLLQYLTGRGEAAAQEMVLKCPAVLTLSVASTSSKWEMLVGCCAAASAAGGCWQQQLQQAAPVTLAMVLCYSPQRLLRLQYVLHVHSRSVSQPAADAGAASSAGANSSSGSSAGRSSRRRRSGAACSGGPPAVQQPGLAGVAWRVLVQESNDAFNRRYPGYATWQQQQQQQQLLGRVVL